MKTNMNWMLLILVAVVSLSACGEIPGGSPSASQQSESDTICFATDKNLIFQNALITPTDAEAAVNRYAKGFYMGELNNGAKVDSLLPNQERIDFQILKAALGAVNSSSPKYMVIRYGTFIDLNGQELIKSFAYFVDDKDNIIEIEDPNGSGMPVKLIYNDFLRCPPTNCVDIF
jgi:hypothetical protein